MLLRLPCASSILILLAVALLPVRLAWAEKPALCRGGRFVVADGPIIPGGSTSPDLLVIEEDGGTALSSECPPTSGRPVIRAPDDPLAAKHRQW